MTPFESIKKPESAELPSPEGKEMKERAEFFENASKEEGQRLKEFIKDTKTRLTVAAFVAITAILGQGLFKDARAASAGGAPSSAVEDVWKKWSEEQKAIKEKWTGETDETRERHRKSVEETRKKFEDEWRMLQSGEDLKNWPKKTSQEKNRTMREKYENWDAYSKAYESFHKTRFNSPEEMAIDFLNVIGAFPKFRGETAAQREIMDKDNFKRMIQMYVNQRNEFFPKQGIAFNRGLLELQIALQQSSGPKEQNYGLSLLRGGGIAE